MTNAIKERGGAENDGSGDCTFDEVFREDVFKEVSLKGRAET